eukprot:CAMPEP_0117421374 /NCGR_PEP_ID=MMETSP0758-20121206/2487_1 /TAXON_ID=63605 /ORGANISM="Percolomonas cosmopolitus, Strain AE-1 (ATCC 50343)" /LENGTH=290 /DNA_ID=CAMNT_0005203477 /DNA_START=186 /DNA_END=1056 /DNA_ORIENTATION=-
MSSSFYYQYVVRLPTPPTLPMALGSALHEAVEHFGEFFIEDRPRNEMDQLLVNMLEIYTKRYKKMTAFMKNDPDVPKRYQDGATIIRDFYLRELPRHDFLYGMDEEGDEDMHHEVYHDPEIAQLMAYEESARDPKEDSKQPSTLSIPISVEEKFEVVLQEGVILNGIIDRIEDILDLSSKENASNVLVEYKTKIGSNLTIYRDQLRFYMLAMMHLNRKTLTGKVVSITNGDAVDYTATMKQLETFRTKIIDTSQAIKNGQFDAKPSQWNCQYCPFSKGCPKSHKPYPYKR